MTKNSLRLGMFVKIKSILVFLLLLTCSPPFKDTVVVVYDRAPRTLDPHLRSELVTTSILSNIYEGLVDYTPELKLVPRLAKAWFKVDSLTWQFELRERVAFHNGKLLYSDDVVYSLYRPFKLANAEIGSLARIIDTIYTINSSRIVIKTKFPYHFLPNELAHIYIVPKDYHDFDKPLGTGPYRITSLLKDSIVCQQNDTYWGKRPQVKKGIFKSISDMRLSIELLKNNETQMVYGIPVEYYHQLKDTIKMVIRKGTAVRYIQLNTKSYPCNNSALRQAMSMAIDRNELVETIYFGLAEPANQYIPAGIIGYCSDLPPLEYNPDKARMIIKKIGKKIRINFSYARPLQRLGSKIADYMRKIGIEVKENSLGNEEFWRGVEKNEFDCYLISSIIATLDGFSGILEVTFHTYNRENGEGLMNRSGYSNSEIDSLIKHTDAIEDVEKRLVLISQIQRLLLNDMPAIPVVWEPRIYGIADYIEFNPRLDQTIRFEEIGFKK